MLLLLKTLNENLKNAADTVANVTVAEACIVAAIIVANVVVAEDNA